MQYNNTPLPIIAIICFTLLPSLIYSWQIQNGGSILSSTSLEEYKTARITPPNIHSPDYYHPIAYGGNVQSSGEDGMVVLTTNIGDSDTPMIIKSNYFMKENVIQEYVIPGNNSSAPYEQEVTMKLWGGGGGGCNGGRGDNTSPLPEEDEDGRIVYSQGKGGGYVEATFSLPIGDKLYIVIGGGGNSEGSLSNSLAGKGGWHGGMNGRSDLSSGGGGGGGFTSVSWNSTVLVAAFGGNGGGNTTYCTAQGGAGGVLRGKDKNSGGYINFDLALNGNVIEEEVITPGVLEIEMLSHDSATFTWNAGSHRHKTTKEYYVQKYTVQLAKGVIIEENTEEIVCSDEDYRLHEHIQRGVDVNRNTTTHVNNLQSSSPYCIRVEAFSIEGLSLGVQVLSFTTKSTPVNAWHQVTVRQRAVSTTSEVAVNSDVSTTDSFCQHSSSLPTGRRGHSMTVIDDNVYIFGGITLKCICNIDETTNERVCKSMNIYSDDLWHFDPVTSLFTQLGSESEHDDWPRGREQHSMTALRNGHLVLIGGISSTNENAKIGEDSELLSDVWVMKDPHHVSSHVFSMSEDESVELKAGQVTSHTLPISLNDANDMCVSDIQVSITLDHSCPKAIEYIKLTAPVEIRDNHSSPQSRDYETKLFLSSMASRNDECSSSSIDLIFSDDAHYDSILSRSSIPTSGTFRPADSLMPTFGGIPIDGDWTLSIGMSQPTYPEVYEGTLNDWKVIVDVKPCSSRPKWQMLASPPSTFKPRRLHTAIAVDNSIFISGGFATGHLNDLWRFDYDTNTWTELKSQDSNAWPMHGQAAYLGEFGLMSYGGLASHGPRTPGEDLWLWDIFEDEWGSLPIAQNETFVHDDQRLSNDIPQGRYLSTISLLNNAHSSIEGPSALLFGGDNGLLHNSHQDSYGYMSNSFLNDVWILSPDGMYISTPMMNGNHREDYCSWMMKDGSTAEQAWNDSCGWDGSMEEESPPGVCDLRDVLIVAWCRKQYQAFTLS